MNLLCSASFSSTQLCCNKSFHMMTTQNKNNPNNFFTYANNLSLAEESTEAIMVTVVSPAINNYKYLFLNILFQLLTSLYKIFWLAPDKLILFFTGQWYLFLTIKWVGKYDKRKLKNKMSENLKGVTLALTISTSFFNFFKVFTCIVLW